MKNSFYISNKYLIKRGYMNKKALSKNTPPILLFLAIILVIAYSILVSANVIQITLHSPADGSNSSNNQSITFSYTAVSNSTTTFDCSIMLSYDSSEYEVWGSTISTTNDSSISWEIGGNYLDGNYGWYVNCSDGGNELNSTVWNFTIDTSWCEIPYENMEITSDTVFCEGSYYLDDTEINGAIIINDSNLTLDCNNAVLYGYDVGIGIYINPNLENITIKNCFIDGYEYGILGQYLENITLENNTLSWNGYGISLPGASNSIIQEGIFINNDEGINLLSVENITIENNDIGDTLFPNDVGIYVEDGINLTIQNNEIYNSYDYGIWTYLIESSKIYNNSIYDNGYEGIFLWDCSNLNISQNEINNNSDSGIQISYSNNIRVENNRITNNSYAGISVLYGDATSSHTIFGNNLSENQAYEGCGSSDLSFSSEIYVWGDGNCTIENNTITNAGCNGILLGNSNSSRVIGNNITGIEKTGILLYATISNNGINNTIDSNYIIHSSENSYAGILVFSERNFLTNNIIYSEVEPGGFIGIGLGDPFLEGYEVAPEDNYLSGNNVSKVSWSFYAENVTNFTIYNDNYYNSSYGIYLEGVGGFETPQIWNTVLYNNSFAGAIFYDSSAYFYDTNFTENLWDGAYLSDSSYVYFYDTNFLDNCKDEESDPCYGVYIDGTSTANVMNGNFINNSDWAIYNDLGYIYLNFNDISLCRNNSMNLSSSWIYFLGGTLEVDDCEVYFGSYSSEIPLISTDGNVTSFESDYETIDVGVPYEFEFENSDSNITLYLEGITNTQIYALAQKPSSSPLSTLYPLKGTIFAADELTEGNLRWALIKIFYTSLELNNSYLEEDSLNIYYYNETSDSWENETLQGINKSAGYVWANVSHLSLFSVFGGKPSIAYSRANHSNVYVNRETIFSTQWDGEVNLHPNGTYILSTNNTGEWANETEDNFTTTPGWANVTITLNDTIDTVIGYRWYASNNDGEGIVTDIFTLVTEAVPPVLYSNVGHNNTYRNRPTSFSILWDSLADLHPNGTYTFSTNNSGEWANDSTNFFISTPSWANMTILLNDTEGTVIGYRWYANNSYGDAANLTDIFTLTTESDIVPPTYSNVGHSNTYVSTSTIFSIQWNDNLALSPRGQYIFSTNNTGEWANETEANFTTMPSWANVTKTLNSTSGILIGYRWYATDDEGNSNSTDIFTLVTATPPSPPGGGGPGGGSPGGGIFGEVPANETNETHQRRVQHQIGELTKAGKTLRMRHNESASFRFAGEEHYLEIKEMHSHRIILLIYSEVIETTIDKDLTEEIDINQDGTKDISITFNGLTDEEANLFLKSLYSESEETKSSFYKNKIFWAIVIILAVFLLIFLLLKKSKKRKPLSSYSLA